MKMWVCFSLVDNHNLPVSWEHFIFISHVTVFSSTKKTLAQNYWNIVESVIKSMVSLLIRQILTGPWDHRLISISFFLFLHSMIIKLIFIFIFLSSQKRFRATPIKGKARLGLLPSFDDMAKKRCCVDNCVMVMYSFLY